MQVTLRPAPIHGILKAPPSKSMAHRAILCAALSGGCCHISNLDYSQDIQVTLAAARQLGCFLSLEPDSVTIKSPSCFSTLVRPVFCGESASTLRFLVPLLSLTGQKVRLTGQGRLMQRPQQVYADLLPQHGCAFSQTEEGIELEGVLTPGEYTLPGNVSSQFISGLLFALPLLNGSSTIHIQPPFESRSYVELTRSMQMHFGVVSFWQADNTLFVPGNQQYQPRDYTVEGDYSQAAFPAILGVTQGNLTISGLRADSLQGDTVLLRILQQCGGNFSTRADKVCFAQSKLHGAEIDLADCPDLGPVLMALAALAEGTTVFRHTERLRLKESDRIAVMQEELSKFGADMVIYPDSVTITGRPLHQPEELLDSHNDHRVAMSLAVLAMAAGFPVRIDHAEAVKKSWPTFWNDLSRMGISVTVHA